MDPTFDPTTLLTSGGVITAVLTTIVWAIRLIGKRLDAFITRIEETLALQAKTSEEMRVTLTEHFTRDELIQGILLDELKRISPPSASHDADRA